MILYLLHYQVLILMKHHRESLSPFPRSCQSRMKGFQFIAQCFPLFRCAWCWNELAIPFPLKRENLKREEENKLHCTLLMLCFCTGNDHKMFHLFNYSWKASAVLLYLLRDIICCSTGKKNWLTGFVLLDPREKQNQHKSIICQFCCSTDDKHTDHTLLHSLESNHLLWHSLPLLNPCCVPNDKQRVAEHCCYSCCALGLLGMGKDTAVHLGPRDPWVELFSI